MKLQSSLNKQMEHVDLSRYGLQICYGAGLGLLMGSY